MKSETESDTPSLKTSHLTITSWWRARAVPAAFPADAHHDLVTQHLAAVQLVNGSGHVLGAGQLHEREAAADGPVTGRVSGTEARVVETRRVEGMLGLRP